MMAKIQGEGPESKGGVNETPTTSRPDPPKRHVPEDEPAPSEDERRKDERLRDLADDLVDGGPFPGEDEREKLGKQLYDAMAYYWGKRWVGDWAWLPELRRRFTGAALRFRAECVGPLEKALRGILRAATSGPWFKADIGACAAKALSALSALSDQAEPSKDIPEDPGHAAVRGRPARVKDGQVETGMEEKPPRPR